MRAERKTVGRETTGITRSRDVRDLQREPRESRSHERQSRDKRTQREPREVRVHQRESRDVVQRKVVPRVAPAKLAKSNLVDSVNPSVDLGPAKPNRVAKSSRVTKSSRSSKSNSSSIKLKFYLDLNDHIEAAPSIGPKSSERFEKIGIHTVEDFLKQTAESVSAKLNYKRMTAKVILDWQNQARLICRIPNLRGHDAQLLVACGYTDPEAIATMQPSTLFATIGPFSETKEGLKIIRNGKKPDLDEITDWITWAGHTRSIKAA